MIYADSSFFVSKYVADVHSSEADRRTARRPAIYLTPLNKAEIANALQRYVFLAKITALEANQVWINFERDCSNGVWTRADLPEAIWDSAGGLAQRLGSSLGVRTLDSLHVACALELKAQKFWTFDQRQEHLAHAVGLNTKP